MEGNFTFEIGEEALDGMNNRVRIVACALRPEDYKNREQYLVRRKTFWGSKEEWMLQASLTKIIPTNHQGL